MDVELVTEGLEFPEGPIAMNDGSVILTEIKGQRLTRVSPDGKKSTVAETGGGPNGAAIGPDGKIYVTNNGGRFEWREFNGALFPGEPPESHKGGYIQRVDIATGKVETVYDSCNGKTIWAPNDLVFDSTGGFWFTDHARPDGDTLNYGGLYYAKADGSHIERARPHMISPNGVGLSPDEKVVYVAETQFGRLWAHDISEPGKLAPGALGAPARVVHNLQGGLLLEIMAVESGGRVCFATIHNGGITAFEPDGSGTEHYPFPDLLTTNICFGGPDMMTAWVTCSSTGKLFKAKWPRPGLKLAFNA
jgi:gluconolactonase